MDDSNSARVTGRPSAETKGGTTWENSAAAEYPIEERQREEVGGYVPTRHELTQLVKYWYGRFLDEEWWFFVTGVSGGRWIQLKHYAMRRIGLAAAALGEQAVDKAIEGVREEFKSKVSDARLWQIFETGTDEQWAAVREESDRKCREQQRQTQDLNRRLADQKQRRELE